MVDDRKIKNWNEFKVTPGLKKNLNHLQFSGTTKGGFLMRENEFKVDIFYSPIRSTIIEIEGEVPGMKLPFKSGDRIGQALEWIKSKGFEITLDIKRI